MIFLKSLRIKKTNALVSLQLLHKQSKCQWRILTTLFRFFKTRMILLKSMIHLFLAKKNAHLWAFNQFIFNYNLIFICRYLYMRIPRKTVTKVDVLYCLKEIMRTREKVIPQKLPKMAMISKLMDATSWVNQSFKVSTLFLILPKIEQEQLIRKYREVIFVIVAYPLQFQEIIQTIKISRQEKIKFLVPMVGLIKTQMMIQVMVVTS